MKQQHNAGRKHNEPRDSKDKSNDLETSEMLSDKHGLRLVQASQDPKTSSVSSQDSNKLTIKQIIKNLLRAILPNFSGVGNNEDPTEKKKRSPKYKLRRLFLQNPDLDEAKYHDVNDTMVQDFIYVDPDTPTITDIAIMRKRRLIDFVAGSIARVLLICVCQPFDTVKVKQQTFPHVYRNMFRCIKLTYHKDGIFRGLYAGTIPAMVASLADHAVLFVAYGSSQATIASALEIESTHELSVFGNGCAGSLAAFFSTFALCPTELVKCKLQSIQEMKSYVAMDGKVAAITPYRLTKQIFQNQGKFVKPIEKCYDRLR